MKHLLTSSLWLVLLLGSRAADSQSTEAAPSAVQPIDNGPGPVDPPEPSVVLVDPPVFDPTPTLPPANPEPTEPSLPVEQPPRSTVVEGILPPQSTTQAAVGQSSAPVDGPTSAQGTVTTPEARSHKQEYSPGAQYKPRGYDYQARRAWWRRSVSNPYEPKEFWPAQTDARGSIPNGETSTTSRATNEEATTRDQPSASTRRGGDSSRGGSRPTQGSSSLAPLSTAKPSDGTGFLGIDLSDGTESSEETPPDTTTPEQHDAEAEANLPFTVISDADAQDVAILEAAMFEYFVENDAQIGDDVQVTIPAVASNCNVGLTRRDMEEERWPGRFKSLVAKRQANCKVVTSLDFDLYFHYMLPSQTAERPNQLSERITASVEYVQSVFGLRNITFTYVGVNFYTPDKDDANWTTVKYKEDRLETWMGETRKGDKMSLNVWLVTDLKKGEGDDERDINEVLFHIS
ncbi:hypothetical protein HYQ45_012419 [Verticillium longisporum]|uniref:Uncharacterized protein n=1 Tax=Verticillium longisporum TaxID=100787 RepID=A0A8I3AKC1_VERLO|nr:hypothetical protein HYQ45_012419 [Verticillium longisporum]